MSRLSNLLRQVEAKDPKLAADLEREVEALSGRRAFGLNFERHIPETVELPGRPVRKGDKVRFLPTRREKPSSVTGRLWRVARIRRTGEERVADLVRQEGPESEPESASRAIEDLVVVAEFRDPIYPGLVSTGKVERGGDKPFHTVINAENFHALQALLYTHEGKVDAIYIDPPYNSGARDWKYNNDYVDSDDSYRHSKWLAMMERRLKLAKRLLNPAGSVLIVTIDEKEYARLALLLEQTFPGCTVQMITVVINPQGTGRDNEFSRTNEYIFFVTIGDIRIQATSNNMFDRDGREADLPIEWRNLRRRERESVRGARPNQFYAVFVDQETGRISSVSDPILDGVDVSTIDPPPGTRGIYPTTPKGKEMIWGIVPDRLRYLVDRGFARVLGNKVQFLNEGTVLQIEQGTIVVGGNDEYGGVIAHYPAGTKLLMPKTVWVRDAHNSQASGTLLVKKLIPGREFPFPKSLYAVEDCLRFFVADKPNAVILDYFAGSGTTAHAVMRLNRQDGGRRQSISVSNNEVSAQEDARLRDEGLRPADAEWEALGICEYITKPRIGAAVTGKTPDGTLIDSDYKFMDERSMGEGFEENVGFFTMTYEAPRPVAHHRAFEVIAPLLWLKAGSQGRRIERANNDFDVADTYGVLFDLDASREFLAAVSEAKSVRMAFIVTDDDRGFQMVCGELPAHVEAVRLYESYLTNFIINTGRE